MTFPIVAIGASAGGLQAASALFSALPATNDMAYVVIQHLDPEHTSLLPELLGKRTKMRVVAIHQGLEVEPGHVYVIPPNVTLELVDGRFHLTPRASGRHRPIDAFFTSLADARAGAAIGVILSGADTDGTLGVHAIKEAGGITFAQAPESAGFPAMPKSAIETGSVDFVLRPNEIALELSRLGNHEYLRARATPTGDHDTDEVVAARDEDLLRGVFRRVRSVHGVDFTRYKRSTLRRRLARRMALTKVDELADYVAVLDDNPAEVAALYQDFLIRVTAFFRDPSSFDGLRERVFPSVCEGRSFKDPVRVWVPGCATGEEVYSIAIALTEYLGDRLSATGVQIFGTDVSEAAIEKARIGRYPDTIAEDVSSEQLARYFVKENSHYRIAKSLRDLCIFARQDVTRDPPFSRLDLVSCRNLLIYLDAGAQKRVMEIFHYSLRPNRFLLLGPSESVGLASELFQLVDKAHRIWTRKAAALRNAGLEFKRGGPGFQPRNAAPEQAAGTPEGDLVTREADHLLLARYAPASLLLDDELNLLQVRGETGPYLEFASGQPSLNLNRVARPELLVEIAPAIKEARETGSAVRREGLRIDQMKDISLEVIPLKRLAAERCYLVVFEDPTRHSGGRRGRRGTTTAMPESEKDRRLLQLEREIAATRAYLEATMEEQEAIKEELKSAHEEVLSSNEEFQSTNEELETAKEELQSANEELTTTNEELRNRNRELSHLNSDLQQEREAAERARAYADAIIDAVREPLVVLDVDLRALRANPAFYADFKVPRDQVEGHLLSEMGGGQWNIPALFEELRAVITNNAMLSSYDLGFSVQQGDLPRALRVSARKVAGDGNRAELILLAIEDVTDRKATAAQLLVASQRKDEFLAMLAHELRNPLTPIAHAIHLLQRGAANNSPANLFDVIERQTTRLIRLVDELLDVARISRGYIELKRDTVDLVDVVRNSVEASRLHIEERGHNLSLALADAPVWVDGDAIRLEQIVANLLENATKYTEPGGRIELTLREDQRQAVLSVRDDGIGLAPETREAIFDLFAQVDGSLARSGGGLGIGLTLVRRLLVLHGGTIVAHSAGLGQGTQFIVRLPLVAPKSAPKPTATRLTTGVPRSRRVLIVDDNEDSGDSLEMLVRAWGHEVAVARDGPSALTLARTFRPELGLLDIGLPGMDGYELARRLRREHREVFLVAMTGYGRDEDRSKALAAGFDLHVVKPPDLDELQELLGAVSRD